MRRKILCGIWGILAVAAILFIAASIYGKTVKIDYIEQIHLQDENLYYVDRGDGENLRIIRSDPDGDHGQMIVIKKHDREQYRMIRQIFFDDTGNAYVLIEEADSESRDGVEGRIYQCDFKRRRLLETDYLLTEEKNADAQMWIQCIRDGKLYYVCIPNNENGSGEAILYVCDENGKREQSDRITLEYPYLNSQFFLSRNQILLWMDYEGEVFAKEVGTDRFLEIEGVTGRKGVFKSLCDDGERAYVMEYEAECIRSIDLVSETSEVVFSAEELQKSYADFTFRGLQSLDCTKTGFCAGAEGEDEGISICSYQNGVQKNLGECTLIPAAVMQRMGWVYAGILLGAALLCLYWIACVRYHVQTILVRLCVIFLLSLLVMDGFLEYWIESSMHQQLEYNQTVALSAMGKILKKGMIHNIEADTKKFPSHDRTLRMGNSSVNGGIERSMYVYSIFYGDEEGQLYVSESMSEYCGVPVEWVYGSEMTEAIYHAYDTEEIVNKSDENRNGRRNNQFIPLVKSDGTKVGVLAVSADGNILDYQVWYYQWNLKNASSTLLLVLTVVLLVILYIFLRPLKTLKECALKLAAGNLGVTVAVHGHDEVADISQAFNQMSLEIARYVRDIQGMSDGYYKFIPAKILDLLNKESIQDVELGDQMVGDMTILSLHAMNYPRQKMYLSAEQVYTDINRVLSLLVEPINRHYGVVEHFDDTGLSAFFTVRSREALDAAIDIWRLLDERMAGGARTIAISYGRVMIGVIGHEQRMEATAISAHSDLAKTLRLKGDKYGAHILITHLVYEQIPDFEEHYHARYLGNIYLSANHSYERVYDVYDGDSEEEFYYKDLTKELFEKGVGLFVARKFYDARLVFVEVLKQHRKDKAAKEYLYRCDRYYKMDDEAEKETVIERF